MRVSDRLIFNQVTNNLQKNMERLLRIQTTLSSGKNIQAPSDDPIKNSQSLTYSTLLSRMEQYGRNIDHGTQTLGLNDSTLSSTSNLLTRARELAVQMRSDTNTADDRVLAAREVNQILRELASLANTKDGETHLYSGDTVRGKYLGSTLGLPVTITGGSNDTLQVSVNGVTSGTVTLTAGAYSTGNALASEVQTRINADVTLGANDVTVSYDSIANRLVLTSQEYGSSSAVDMVSGSSRTVLGLVGGTSTRGDKPFMLATTTASGARNTGTGSINTGTVQDENQATLNDYAIKFTSAAQYSLYNISGRATVSDISPTASDAVATEASVTDTGDLTLDTYEIQFTSATAYDVVDMTRGVTVSSGNTYASGGNIDFDGLRVIVQDGSTGGPSAGDIFSVSTNGVLISSGNSYTSGTAIAFDGLSITLSGVMATNDAFTIETKYVFNGDLNDRRLIVGEGTTAEVGMSGGDLFTGVQGGLDILGSLKDFYNSLLGNNPDGLDGAIDQMDQAMNQIVSAQATVGARMNHLETTKQNIEAFQVNISAFKSDIEDIDISKVATELTMQENALQVAINAAARVIQPSLMDFLK